MKNVEYQIEDGTLYWITGLSGAGKTTVGNRLYYELKKYKENVVLLDGDILKKVVMDNDDENIYSYDARKKRAIKYSKICKMLTDQGMIVICCTIAMYDEVRNWNRKNNKRYVEVFLDVPMRVLLMRNQKGLYSDEHNGNHSLVGVNIEPEFPKFPDIRILNDGSCTVAECVKRIMKFKATFSSDYDRDTTYWNNYYKESRDTIAQPSPFAIQIAKYLDRGKSILELGCGNGRDSLYFDKIGLCVTAIDASDKAISKLKKTKCNNSFFICDDFVCATALYTGQYDYVYSRFSLHAINADQENEVIANVFNVLKDGGQFFIEVRSVLDDIYGLGDKVGEDSFFYNGHYRRFVRKNMLEEKLKEIGFKIEYSEEKRGFAPFGDSDPIILRIIAKK